MCEYETDNLADDLSSLFESVVDIPRIRYGKKQSLDTLICEETLQLARYLRDEQQKWNPRLPMISNKGLTRRS